VLQDLYAVAIEATNNRTRGCGTEAPSGDTWLVLQCVAEGHFDLFLQVLPGQHRCRLIDLELASQITSDAHLLGEVQFWIDADRKASDHRRAHGDFGPSCGVALSVNGEVIRPRGHIGKGEHAI